MRVRGDSIQIDFRYQGVRCRETLSAKPTKSNMQYAMALRDTIKNEITLGTFDYAAHFPESPRCRLFGGIQQTKLTVGLALNQWIKGQGRSVAHSTLNTYKKAIKHDLIPAFGDVPLSKLSTAMIRSWISSSTLAPKSVNNLLTPLRRMLADAFDDGLISRDPCARIRNLKTETPEPDPFTPDEMKAIINNLTGQVRNIIQFAFFTGMRTSELVAIQWDDIDLLNGVARVSRAKVLRQIKTTKTEAGTRDVKLLEPALEAIEAQKAHTYLAGNEVFLNPNTGRPWVSDKALREGHWKHALKRAGVRYRYPYHTRHTYASLMLSAGENPMWVAHQMGHANMAVLLKRYARWIPDVNPHAGAGLVTIWSQVKI